MATINVKTVLTFGKMTTLAGLEKEQKSAIKSGALKLSGYDGLSAEDKKAVDAKLGFTPTVEMKSTGRVGGNRIDVVALGIPKDRYDKWLAEMKAFNDILTKKDGDAAKYRIHQYTHNDK